MNRLAAPLLALCAATTLLAQDVTFSGKCEDGEAVCYYCPGFDYVLDNTHTKLVSSTIALAPFVGQYVTGTGVWNGSTTSPTITVTAMSVVPESFSIGGGGALGGEVSFTVHGVPGDFAVVALGLSDGFVPVAGYGTLFLSPQSLFVLGQGVVDGESGEFDVEIPIPNNPALAGFQVFGQAGLISSGGATRLTNSDRKVIG